ncbi:hypothetical protein [Chryseobacterium indoltheticum]|uniref:hypothetical protein n=1 Tax=Chryseobacterium indoltheticum TaxID=254 RepID=UPI003F49A7D9
MEEKKAYYAIRKKSCIIYYLQRSSVSIIGVVGDMEAPRIASGTGIKRNKSFSPFCSKADEGKRFEKYCKEKI